MSYVDGELSIRGVDKLGRRYSFSMGTGAPGCELWASDLTGSGSSDLEIIVGGIDSSGGYDTTLTVLLFDADGRPFPWQATGKFSSGPKGIDQVISDGSANANILVSTDEGADTVNHNLVFELYKFSPQKIAKVEGASLGRTWPVMQTPNQSVIAHHSAPLMNLDLSANTTLSDSLVPTSTAQVTGSSRLTLSTGVQTEPPVMLVKDSSDGTRVIDADPTTTDIRRLVASHATIKALGRSCDEEECRPMVFLVKQ